MARVIFSRLVQMIFLLFGIIVIVFLSLHLAPGDPATLVAGPQASASDIAQIRVSLGLNKPLYVQFINYLVQLLHGNFGTSYQYHEPVAKLLFAALLQTISLAVCAIIVAIVIGVITGILSAVYQNTWIDHTASIFSLLGISIPNFWLGALLILVFAVNLGWFPVGGLTHPVWTLAGLNQIILPAVTLGAGSAAIISRMSRSSMLEVIRSDYIRTAWAKGVKPRNVILVHALRNALIPVVTVVGVNFGILLGGAIITENVFSIQGLGTLVVDAISRRDFPVVQGVVLIIAFIFVIINLMIDIIYTFIDPRITYE